MLTISMILMYMYDTGDSSQELLYIQMLNAVLSDDVRVYLAGLLSNTALVQGDQLYAHNVHVTRHNVQCRISKTLTKEHKDAGLTYVLMPQGCLVL